MLKLFERQLQKQTPSKLKSDTSLSSCIKPSLLFKTLKFKLNASILICIYFIICHNVAREVCGLNYQIKNNLFTTNLQQTSNQVVPGYSNNQQQQTTIEKCCACDEAKFELVFEGLWSRYTHPDYFPENYWVTYFSDVIGASHTNDYSMWAENQYASDGVKELAQSGSTKKLEAELKQVSPKIRTIIKAKELRYPVLNSKTFAVFRTDKTHHLVSILSKLGPSPDWMVGVSSLELCQKDCTWATQRVVNLNLWDAGTDSGESFIGPSSPRMPQDTIRPFRRTNLPSNNDQQFNFENPFDQTTNAGSANNNNNGFVRSSRQANISTTFQMKPFARLVITRQRIYDKTCSTSDEEDSSSQQNAMHNLTPKIDPAQTQPQLTDTVPEYTTSVPIPIDCRVTEWSDWSACSATCGKGLRTRIRNFFNDSLYSNDCPRSSLIEREECLSECVGNLTCSTRAWSHWSNCSVNCGHGFRQRVRHLIDQSKKACTTAINLIEREPCVGQLGVDCSSIDDEKNIKPGGSNNNGQIGDCKLTSWSPWSQCSVSCGKFNRKLVVSHSIVKI